MHNNVKRLYRQDGIIGGMNKVTGLLAIYALLILLLAYVLQPVTLPWVIANIAGILLLALAVCRLIMARMKW